tara:strand:- start:18 stop:335 length:318 start_codon:yes stop_codon:yes gene_type:complete
LKTSSGPPHSSGGNHRKLIISLSETLSPLKEIQCLNIAQPRAKLLTKNIRNSYGKLITIELLAINQKINKKVDIKKVILINRFSVEQDKIKVTLKINQSNADEKL